MLNSTFIYLTDKSQEEFIQTDLQLLARLRGDLVDVIFNHRVVNVVGGA